MYWIRWSSWLNGTGPCHTDHVCPVRLSEVRTYSSWASSGFAGVLTLDSDKGPNASRLGQSCCGLLRGHHFGSIPSPICYCSRTHGTLCESRMLSAKKILNQIHLVFSVNNLLFLSNILWEINQICANRILGVRTLFCILLKKYYFTYNFFLSTGVFTL